MGLLKNFLGKARPGRESPAGPASLPPATSMFQESEPAAADASPADEQAGRNQKRRDLLQLVLRDTMRKHGIPSDWIESRILTVASRSRASGMHLQLIVRQGEDRLLTYVHAFQDSLRTELQRFEPKAGEWLFSIAWEFTGRASPQERMPDPASWVGQAPSMAPGVAKAAPAAAAAAAAAAQAAPVPPKQERDEDLEEDLRALFAIRDAALQAKSAQAPGDADDERDDPRDFQPTRPWGG